MEITPNPKCPRCRCYWKPTANDIMTSGLVAKTCNKCRYKQRKTYNKTDNKEKKDPVNDTINNTEPKKINKCIICKELWDRVDTDKIWESIECYKCYKCRAGGGNPDIIDITHEIYPEPVKKKSKKPDVWNPDSSESD